MKYPCSYMIYSDAFNALPESAKDAIYVRMWEILSGQDRSQRYQILTRADRQAVVDILRDTKEDLPEYFRREARLLRRSARVGGLGVELFPDHPR